MAALAAPVVVAVATAGGDAVEWAAAEAAARRSPLLVVHVVRRAEAGSEVLRAAVDRALAVAPDLQVTGDLLAGSPDRVLADRSRDAALLVLGGRRRSSGAVAGHLVVRASCPVAVVPRPARPGPAAGPRVVVGVDVARPSGAAVEFAVRAAAQRGLPLVAVHAWSADSPADLEGVCGPPRGAEPRAAAAVDQLLRPWREVFPDVPVQVRLEQGDPVTVLAAGSAGAALLVVGAPRRSPVLGVLFGSVGPSVVRRAPCPVAVVGPGSPEG